MNISGQSQQTSVLCPVRLLSGQLNTGRKIESLPGSSQLHVRLEVTLTSELNVKLNLKHASLVPSAQSDSSHAFIWTRDKVPAGKVTENTVLILSAIYPVASGDEIAKKKKKKKTDAANKNMVCLTRSCHADGEIEHIGDILL